jgi:hypothetical protein
MISEEYKSAYREGYSDAKKAVWDFSYKPINPFDDGLSKEDRMMINAIRDTAYICGRRGEDVEHTVHYVLRKIGRYDLLPPCERK